MVRKQSLTCDYQKYYRFPCTGGNVLAIPPINQTVMEGEGAQFTCNPKDRDSMVNWFKDGTLISDLDDLPQRSTVTVDGTLIIHTTEISDLGEYECEAINFDGERQRARAYLNVQCKINLFLCMRLRQQDHYHKLSGRPLQIFFFFFIIFF